MLSALPDPKEAIEDIAEALGPWTYALVGVMAFLETGAFVGLIAPGETVVIAGGVIAGQGEIDLLPLIGLVWVCAVLGDTASFFIGRRLGRNFLEKHGPKVKITHERLEQVEGYFDRHGGKTILIGRFIGLVRALAPFVAGSSGLPYRRFIPFSIVGTGLWATIFCVLGYIFWRSFDRVAHLAGQAVFGFGITVGVIVGVVTAYRRRDDIRAWLLAHERHPAVRPLFAVGRPLYRGLIRPLVRVLGPEVRFLWDRLTPGGIGLEVTTAAAVGGAGAYVFIFYAEIVSGSTSLTTLDRRFFDTGRHLRADWAVDVAKVVSDLGSFPTVAALVVVASIVLISQSRYVELGRAAPGVRDRVLRGGPGQGGGGPAPARGPAGGHLGVRMAERPRRLLHDLGGGGGGAHAPPRGCPTGRDHHRLAVAGRGHRTLPRLPARPLLVGCGWRVGARSGRLRPPGHGRADRLLRSQQ